MSKEQSGLSIIGFRRCLKNKVDLVSLAGWVKNKVDLVPLAGEDE